LKVRTNIVEVGVIFFAALLFSQAQTPSGSDKIQFIDGLITEMTLEEKLGQLNQQRWAWQQDAEKKREMYRQHIRSGKIGSFLGIYGVELTLELQRIAVEESRLGIPLLFAQDVIHGWRTIFPVPLAEACSWNPQLVEKSARTAAIEATAHGIHWNFAPMVDIARDPRWGRIVEGSGEDPYLGSVMAAARVRGFQGDNIAAHNTLLACAKHYCAYGGAEGGRDYNTVDISEITLREIYLPPFKAAANVGVHSFMGAFNEIGGIPMHTNKYLINGVLRDEWDWEGVVISDFTAIMELQRHGVAATPGEAGVLAMHAGVDVDMVSGIYLNDLPNMIQAGRLSESRIDESVRRVLHAKYILGLFEDPYRYHDPDRERENMRTPENRTAAEEIAREAIVLLKNDNRILPLSAETKKIAVIGALAADQTAPLGSWHGDGREKNVITVLDGIRKAASPGSEVMFHEAYDLKTFKDMGGFEPAIETVKKSDVVILVLGEGPFMTGEANNRADIGLPGDQLLLAQKLIGIHKQVIIVLMNGRPLVIPWLAENAPAILECWFLGTEMGTAVADILFGNFNPSGKVTTTFPRATGQIPIYYNHKTPGRPPLENDHYTSKYLDLPWTPLYPFGFGLSYTTFKYSNLKINTYEIQPEDSITVSIDVENTGSCYGQEVVQIYVRDEVASITPAVKKLRGFTKIGLKPGQKKTVQFRISEEDLSFYNQDLKRIVEPGLFTVFVGGNSRDVLSAEFTVTQGSE
jgi:beta-glucosidase